MGPRKRAWTDAGLTVTPPFLSGPVPCGADGLRGQQNPGGLRNWIGSDAQYRRNPARGGAGDGSVAGWGTPARRERRREKIAVQVILLQYSVNEPDRLESN